MLCFRFLDQRWIIDSTRKHAENDMTGGRYSSRRGICWTTSGSRTSAPAPAALRSAWPSRTTSGPQLATCTVVNGLVTGCGILYKARSRLYRTEISQENMRLKAFFELYKICILLHRCNLKILAKIGLKNRPVLSKFSKQFTNVAKSAKFCNISIISAR